MQKSQIDVITLVAATLAAAIALGQLPGPFSWLGSAAGLLLLFLLLAFDQEGYRNIFQSLAFAGVCGFCAAVACGAIFRLMASNGEIHLENNRWETEYVPLACAFATAIFWAIDLMRMNARKMVPIQVPRALGETRIFPQPPVAAAPPQPAYYPPPPPAYQQPAPPPAPVYQQLAPPPPIYQPAEEVPVAAEPAPVHFEAPPPQYQAPAESQPPVHQVERPLSPGPASIVSRGGKETTIYVTLLGEGLNLLRSVRAESLGHDFFLIIEEMPEGETWQFQPGQVVRCKKRTLSSGKAMVAIEEAPRSA